jgi:putative ABC transport system permease protein
MSLLRAANRRFFYRHPRHLLLAVAGIALGVGIFTAVDLSTTSSRQAFRLSLEAVVGRTSHQIVGSGADGLDEALYVDLRLRHGWRDISPVVEGHAGYRDETLRILGIDPLAMTAAQKQLETSTKGLLTRLTGEPATALLGRMTAEHFGLHEGDRLRLQLAGTNREVELVGLIEGDGPADPALEGLLLTDIATAQELLDRVGRLDRIDVQLPADGKGETRLREALPADAVLRNAEGHNAATVGMTDAFTLNLRAMSILALLVGLFLIYNTLCFNLLQRRPLMAKLRVLGVTRRELVTEILLEAVLLGLVGSAVGVALGWMAAQWLVQLVTRTINDVYFLLTVTHLYIAPAALARGLLMGTGATVLAVLPPALEAVWSQPATALRRSVLERRSRRWALIFAGIGVMLLAGSVWLLNETSTSLSLAMAAVSSAAVGYSLMVPAALLVLAGSALRTAGRRLGALPTLALRGITGTLSRTGVAAAALTLAVAMSIGTSVMIHSFRLAVSQWLDRLMQADIQIALPSAPGRPSQVLPNDLVAQAKALPGVARVSTGLRVTVKTSYGSSELVALAPAYPERSPFRFKGGHDDTAWQSLMTGDAVAVSEPYASRHGLKAGDTLTLQTPQGPATLPVSGVFYDYRSDQGVVLIHRPIYDRLWRHGAVSSLGLYLAPGANLENVKAEARHRFEGQGLLIRASREIRETSLTVFDRTFTVTRVMRLLAAGVAFIGIFSALLALQSERGRELATLRAIGFTPGQIRGLVLLQSGLLGLLAGLLALPLGWLVGDVLVRVINLRSFGWSMDLVLPPSAFGEAVPLAMVAGLLAGTYPAWLAARVPPAVALREE